MSPAASTQPVGKASSTFAGTKAIVPIPGMPGESIDARILPDVRWIIEKYKVKVTDGYATSGHAADGEHPLGLAVDVVPDIARGGTWADVDRLMAWAEPKQGSPIAPFRWVGYTGDAGHGRGDHGHLSWLHPGGNVQTLGKAGAGAPTGAPTGGSTPAASSSGPAIGDEERSGALKALLWVVLIGGGAAVAGLGLARMVGVRAPVRSALGAATAAKGKGAPA